MVCKKPNPIVHRCLAIGYLSPILIGSLAAYSFSAFAYAWTLNLFTVCVFIYLCEKKRGDLLGLISIGFRFGLGIYGTGLWFIFDALVGGGLSYSIALLAWLCTTLFCIFFLMPFLTGYYYLKNVTPQNRISALTSLWVFGEWLRGLVFTGFPMLLLGYAQVDGPLGAYAPIGGALLCSALTILIALTLIISSLHKT